MTLNLKIYHYQFINDKYYYNYIFNNNIIKIFFIYKLLYQTIFYKKIVKDNFLNFKTPLKLEDLNKIKTSNENLYNRVIPLLESYVSS
jgi:hypothetical protein